MHPSVRTLLAAALIGGSALNLQARIERVVTKEFSVPAAGALHVQTSGGSIQVVAANDGIVRVKAKQRIRADSEAEADELLKKLDLEMEQNGNDVRVTAKYENRSSFFGLGSSSAVQVDFEVAVPRDFATNLHTSGGRISVGDLNGAASLRTSGGSISLGKMGGAVDARTSGGSITLGAARGPVELRTSGGNITTGRVDGSAELSTSGGGIKVESVAGPLRAHTSGGSIRAGISGAFKDECSLSTSGGSVRVTVDKAAAFRLDASASGGGVDAEGITLTLENLSRSRGRLAGAVNGGGPLLKLRTSGGGISVRAQ